MYSQGRGHVASTSHIGPPYLRSCNYEDLLADAVAAGDEDEPSDGDALVDADDDADAVVGDGDVRTDGEAVAVGDWDARTDGDAVAVGDVNVLANDGAGVGEDTPWNADGWAEACEAVGTADDAAAGAEVCAVACS
jgi:hypothetical protein